MSGAAFLILTAAAMLSNCGKTTASCQGSQSGLGDDVVNTTLGIVQGLTEEIQTTDGQKIEVNVFLGIPFAKPPVGDRRFRDPVPRDSWDGVYQATTPPNSCMQVLLKDPIIAQNTPTPLSEDCLYLNIWRPRCDSKDNTTGNDTQFGNDSNATEMSTLVWIHGGLATTGSSTIELYNGAKLAASECVIVVSVNYRLGALGMIFLDVPENTGNMGLRDVTMALNWIKDNTENFGGNQNKITLVGNGAGGIIVSLLMQSHISQELFKSAIMQSGTTGMPIPHQTKRAALAVALDFSNMLHCNSTNRSQIVECLKQVDADDLAEAYVRLTQGLTKTMAAVNDGYFLSQTPRDSLIGGAMMVRHNLLTGYNKEDGLHLLSYLWPEEYNFRRQQPPSPLTQEVLEKKLIQIFNLGFKQEHTSDILEKVKVVYQLDTLSQQLPNASHEALLSIVTDLYFTCPARLQAAAYARKSNDAFLYAFNHRPEKTLLASWVGATYKSEIPFIFGNTVPDIPFFSDNEVKLSQTMMTFWANFAKFGNPTPHKSDSIKWPAYSPPDPGNILVFNESAGIEIGRTEVNRCSFWENLSRNYFKD